MVNERLLKKSFLYLDRAIAACLSLAVFCLPFLKAGIETFVWTAFFLWLLKRALGYRSDCWGGLLPRTELNAVLAVFIVINALAVIFTVNAGLSLRAFFGKQLKYLAIYFMLCEVIDNKTRLKCVLMAILASAAIVVVDAGVQYFRGADFFWGHPFSSGYALPRIQSCFGNPNSLAGWSIVVLPLGSSLLFSRLMNRCIKVILIPLAFGLLLCLGMTQTRGAWAGISVAVFLISCLFLVKTSSRNRIIFLSVFAGLLVLLVVLPRSFKDRRAVGLNSTAMQTFRGRITSGEKGGEGSWSVRINLWKESLMIITDHPLLGSGLNTYSTIIQRYKSPDEGRMYAHNSYLQMATETGVLGLLAFLGVCGVFFKTVLRYLGKNNDPLVWGLLTGILAFLIHSFFDNHLYAMQLVVLFWFMVGLTMAVTRFRSDIISNNSTGRL